MVRPPHVIPIADKKKRDLPRGPTRVRVIYGTTRATRPPQLVDFDICIRPPPN